MRIEITNAKTLKLVLAIVGLLAFASAPAAPKDFELHQAVLDNDLQLVKKFLTKGAYVNLIGSRKYGYGSALHLAVREGHLDIARLLLKRGAQVDVLDPDDFTPLHNAAWNGNLEMTQLLLEAGADIEASTYDGDTPLKLARNNDQPKVAEFIQAKLHPPATSETKVESTSVSDSGVIDISGTYTNTELTYPREVTRYKDWMLGKGKNLELTIQQSGSTVTGVFSGDLRGNIKGLVDRNEITFEFDGVSRRGSSNYGEGVLFLSEDSTELIGTFKLDSGHYGLLDGKWNFRKIEAEPPQVIDISGTYIAETTGSGGTQGFIKRLNGKLIVLKQTGNTITGSVSLHPNRIKGTREGNIINFYVTAGNEINGSWEINADATNLEGKWHTDGGGGASGKWNLSKVVQPTASLTGSYMADITGSRVLLRTILRSPESGSNQEIELVQNGNQITGTFDDGSNGGKIYGDIEGDTIRFEWYTRSGSSGRGKWTVKPGSNEIVGNFNKDSSTGGSAGTGKWNLTKVE